jgi:NTE family protein
MRKTDSKSRNIALVLGGGSARGLAHIGVLKALERNKIPIDFVVGTSIGSLIGAMHALDIPMKKAEEMALKTRWWHLADFVISKTGFFEGRNLENIIIEAIESKGFKDLKKPFAVTATDIEQGQEVIITSGELFKAIRASCSIPGIFIPVRLDGRVLVDGGLKSSVPTHVARNMGAEFIIAVDVGFCVRRGKVSNILQIVFQAIQIVGNELNKYQASQAECMMNVELDEDIDQMAFDKADYIIAQGQKAAEKSMPSLVSKLKAKGFID